jgi:glycosyltransferase involved in cell wall biosynthesis
MAELIQHQRTGLHFTPGDPGDLAAAVEWAWTHPEEMTAMGVIARAEYELKYTPERNYQALLEIYNNAAGCHASRRLVPLERERPIASSVGR